eukprot:4126374-Amphidinium_carterae.1
MCVRPESNDGRSSGGAGHGTRRGENRWSGTRRPDGYDEPFDEEGDGLARRQASGVLYRRAEASTITIAAIPSPAQFRSWRISTLREVAAASLWPER